VSAVLYITRNGLLEPLGQSQVFAYLRGLSGEYRIILITSEKLEDLADNEAVERVHAKCREYGVDWRPRRFHGRPKILAPAWSTAQLFLDARRLARTENVRLIHARSYLPAGSAWLVWRLRRVPFIFDMRALWPEEMITAGRLRRGSWVHRLLVTIERVCLRDAAAVVSLTGVGVEHLRAEYPEELQNQRIVVIPTCADLDRFAPPKSAAEAVNIIRFGCCGTVLSGWFRLDLLSVLYQAAASRFPDAEFEIVTRDSVDKVKGALAESGFPANRLNVYSSSPDGMPDILRNESVNVMLYAGDATSELGRSPTRMAEVLGCGRPVIANSGVGDVAEIIKRYRVGVVMESDVPDEIERVLDELEVLLADPELSTRCRKAAEGVFSLEAGTQAYRELYADILGAEKSACAD